MPAIVSVGDHICLQSRKFLKHLESDRFGSKVYLKKSILQAYLVPSNTEIAGIFDPLLNQDCRHIWSLLQPKLRA